MKSVCTTCKAEYEPDDPQQNVCWDCAEHYLNYLRAEWESERMAKRRDEMRSQQEDREPSGMDMCPGGCGEAVMFCSCKKSGGI